MMYWELVFSGIRIVSHVFAVISVNNCLLTFGDLDCPKERKIFKWSVIVLMVCLLNIIFIK